MLFLLLPAYNEAPRLPGMLARVAEALEGPGVPWRVLLVDDGSRDGTADAARRACALLGVPIEVRAHARNEGLGRTIRDLFAAALARAEDSDVLVRMDADGTQSPGALPAMLDALDAPGRGGSPGAEVVIASRYAAGAKARGVGRLRDAASRAANAVLRRLFPEASLRDCTSGFRAFRAGAARRALGPQAANLRLTARAFGFAVTPEKALLLRAAGARFAEVPISLDARARSGRSPGAGAMLRRAAATGVGLLVLALGAVSPGSPLRRRVVRPPRP